MALPRVKGAPEGPRDEGVDLLLRVLLVGAQEREVERHPDVALVAVVVLLQELAGARLDIAQELVEHAERRGPARSGSRPAIVGRPGAKTPSRPVSEAREACRAS